MASSRSLKLSLDGKRQVEHALTDKVWGNDELMAVVDVQIASVKKFRAGKAVDRKNFVKFCQELGLDWKVVAELVGPPAPNSGGAKPLEKSELVVVDSLQQDLNKLQGVQVLGSEVTIVDQMVYAYQNPEIRDCKIVADTVNESRTIQFLVKIGDHAYGYWHEVEKPTPVYSIRPLPDECVQFFEIDLRKFVDDVDPSFDITLISNLDSLNIVHQFGLDVISIANDWKAYGVSQAAEVLQQAKYEIEIPDIRNEIALEQSNARFPRLLESRKINRSLTVSKNTKFILDADQKILNYEVLLKNYMQNMPNYAVIQFWVKTQGKQYFSDLIQIFSL
jgi:hypothetical protein